MKIKKLEIVGFKSFVDRAVVVFDHDVTGVVGPNGCGKSNIVDAIRWVMGEQSAKNLRGRAMEDVIFNGSESRGAHSFAEVALTFDNSDGLAPPEYKDYAEITVSRRLDREGRSDYFINKTPVRLLDVTNLFLGTGVGKRAYSIIEQGRIGVIVSSKPEDRRHLIEEAAGVTKFKARKRAAERKMELTKQNLLRVSDVIAEIERTLVTLKRQAQKAERYKRYRTELRDLELHVASFRWLEIVGAHRVIASELDAQTATSDGQRLALRVREAEVEAERIALATIERRVDGVQTRAYEADNRVRILESQIDGAVERLAALREAERQAEAELAEIASQRETLERDRAALVVSLRELEERAARAGAVLAEESEELDRRRGFAAEAEREISDARSRLAEVDTKIARGEANLAQIERRRAEARERVENMHREREHLEQKLVELGEDRVSLEARLSGLRAGRAATAAEREELERQLEVLRIQIRASDETLEELRERLAEKRSRLRSLEQIQERFEGVGVGVRALVTHANGTADPVQLLADRVECPPDLTAALAAALGDRLQWVVVESLERGVSAIELLKTLGSGRATVIPREPRRIVGPPVSVPEGASVIGRLLDLVEVSAKDSALFTHLLADVVVVEDLATAIDLHRSARVAGRIVTRAGEVLSPDGGLTGGEQDAGAHLLELKREVRELHEAVRHVTGELERAQHAHGELRAAIAGRQAALDSARTETHGADLAIVEAEKDHHRSVDDGAATEARLLQLRADLARAVEALEADEERSAALHELEDARRAREGAAVALAEAEEVLEARRQAIEEQTARVTEVRVLAAQADERAGSDRAQLERLERSLEELAARAERVHDNALHAAEQQGRLLGQLVTLREGRGDAVTHAMHAQDELRVVRSEYDLRRADVGAHEEALKELRSGLSAASKRENELALKEQELAMSMSHLMETVRERHRIDVRSVIVDYHDKEIPDAATTERITELSRLIERMGEINLTAIEEYEEKSARFEYLTRQRADLEEALRQLDRAIRQMNRESKRLFTDAFHAINERFKMVFPAMFGGGRAELRLSNPEDMLESGVEISAQPPGKRLGSLELMSGGEKALTAVSLIFAIFQYKPSPFCLLDEVDAPLDEANIGRFADAIRQMTDRSQFIIITHAKRTMESTDVLYGVTMEEPGVSKLVAVEMRGQSRRSFGDRQAAVA
jgi:chromosome segregation protein